MHDRCLAPLGCISVLVLILLIVSYGCRDAFDDSTGPCLRIISPHAEGVRIEFAGAFTDWHQKTYGEDVRVEWLDQGGTSGVIRYLESKYANHGLSSGIDLIFGGGLDPYVRLKALGFLAMVEVAPDILTAIPADCAGVPLYDPEYTWFGAALSGFGVIINQALVQRMGLPRVTTWEDLADEALSGWVVSGNPRFSGSAHMMYEIILQVYGWEKGLEIITRIGANVRRFTRTSQEVPLAVVAGEAAYGLCIDFYAWDAVARYGEDAIRYVFPRDMTVLNPDCIAMLKGAPHPRLARRFIEFVLSREGQTLWMWRKGTAAGPKMYPLLRMGVRADLYEDDSGERGVTVNPFQWDAGFLYDAEKGAVRWNILNDLLEAMIIDHHDRLVRADPRAAVLAPVVHENALHDMALHRWHDPSVRGRTRAAWSREFKRRYEQHYTRQH